MNDSLASDPKQVEFRPARRDEYADVLALWGVVWSEGPYFRAYLEGDPWLREPYCQVAVADERVVSCVMICRRPMRLGDPFRFRGNRVLTFGGIANVATHPEYRRRGYSSELLARCVRVMEEDRFDFSALGTGIHAHYERHGWFQVPIPHPVVLFDSERPLPTADPDIQPLTPAQWIAEAPPVYAAYNARLPLHFDRSLDYWNGWLRIRSQGWEPGRSILIGLRREGVLEGYLVGWLPNDPGGTARVEEIAAIQPEQVAELLRAAARIARVEGASALSFQVPEPSGAVDEMTALGPIEHHQSHGSMFRGFGLSAGDLYAVLSYYKDGKVTWWGPDNY